MTSAAAFVTDAALKKVLKENAGIGTEATRAGIIDTLVKRGFLVREKKTLRSTPLGRNLVDVLPGTLTDPGLTALWEQMLDEVAAGRVIASGLQLSCQTLKTQLHARLAGEVTMTCHPHRIGHRGCVSLRFQGETGRIDMLITVSGRAQFPQEEDYQAPRWYIDVADMVDALYLVLWLGKEEPGGPGLLVA